MLWGALRDPDLRLSTPRRVFPGGAAAHSQAAPGQVHYSGGQGRGREAHRTRRIEGKLVFGLRTRWARRSGKETRLPKLSALRWRRPAPRRRTGYLAGQHTPLQPASAGSILQPGPFRKSRKTEPSLFWNRASQLDFWIQTPAFIRCVIIRLDSIPPL